VKRVRVAIACDHGGYTLKQVARDALAASGAEVVDLGTEDTEAVDYPDFAYKAVTLLFEKQCERIILICGTGIGMSIFANRIPGVRGALCHDCYTARMSRLHNDSNCLILGGRVIGPGTAREVIDVWMNTPFEGGRHAARLAKIDALSRKVRDSHDKLGD
jgi:ribose 5-phosphate isomerase B